MSEHKNSLLQSNQMSKKMPTKLIIKKSLSKKKSKSNNNQPKIETKSKTRQNISTRTSHYNNTPPFINEVNKDLLFNQSIQPSCDICQHFETYVQNESFICCLCFNATHQTCYGAEIYDKKVKRTVTWMCERCVNFKKTMEIPQCFICNRLTGLMRKFNSDWAHIDCIEWNRNLTYNENEK
jgi:hypothetical protein